MRLSPKDIDKLVLHNAGFVAQKRYARGLKLNYPEATALIATQLLEFIRDGERVAVLMDKGKQLLGLADVMAGVAEMVDEVQVEGTFPDGTKLVTVHQPICRERGDAELALYGSGLVRAAAIWSPDNSASSQPGQSRVAEGELDLNTGRETVELEVVNTGDRPVQVGSHYPFFEVNAELRFARAQAYGFRLDIPSGTAVRFEPGESKSVRLVSVAGRRVVHGGSNLIAGELSEKNKSEALQRARQRGFLGAEEN